MVEERVLDLGCGNRKRPGAMGVDHNPESQADVIHSLDVFPYPFQTARFDTIIADNVLEHLEDIPRVMEELHRICRPGGRVKIVAPYFRAPWSFIDPTHKHHFTVDSFSYFDPAHAHHRLFGYCKARFAVERVVFNEGIDRGLFYTMVKRFANSWPGRYERHLSHLFPLDSVTFYLRALG
ncbi:MAG: methyltransferase domain-containing protein [Elusimicrobiota bacterium]